jgi:DNA repair protein RadC
MAPIYQDMEREEIWLIMMHNNTVIRQKMIFRGSATEATFDTKPIMKEALISGANVICMTHNHPSGDPTPSHEDNMVTVKLKNACRQLDISLFDHVIIGRSSYYSYADHDLI